MGIHNCLSNRYKLLAAVLAYIGNLLLRTIPIVHSEMDSDSSQEAVRIAFAFGNLPRPDRSEPALVASESSRWRWNFLGTFQLPGAYLYSIAPTVEVSS